MMNESETNNDTVIDSLQITPLILQQFAETQRVIYKQEQKNNEIDLAELWGAIWSGKWLIVITFCIFSVSSVFYALQLPNIYKSEALLAPASEKSGGMGGLASQFGGIASIAGINLGATGIDKTTLALETLLSRTFILKFVKEHEMIVPLMAAKGWDSKNNKLIYNDKIFNEQNMEWIQKKDTPQQYQPSKQDIINSFKKIITIEKDEQTALVTISIKYFSPYWAQKWLDLLIESINLEMKNKDLVEAEENIKYLRLQLDKTKINELIISLHELISQQVKVIMVANVRKEYVFKVIDPAYYPEVKSGPRRAIICVFGSLLGGFLAVFVLLIRFLKSKSKNKSKSK